MRLFQGDCATLAAGSLAAAAIDVRRFAHPTAQRNGWWFNHMGSMLRSYTGVVTAFVVQNVGPFAFRSLDVPSGWYWLAAP